ncbi:MAG: polyhydroxyalkanoic acid system family protein [Planctomycetota bacterium]|jgi:hypothetical protein
MPSLSVAVPHSLGQDQAIQRLKAELLTAKGDFGQHVTELTDEWNDNVLTFSFKSYGMGVQGTVTTGESEVRVDARLPLAAALFKGTIQGRIREEFERILA